MPQLTKDEANVYRLGDLVLTPAPTESLLAMAYIQMEADGLLDRVYYEGVPRLGWFLNQFAGKNTILACWVRTGNSGSINADLSLAGLTWFNDSYPIGRSQLRKAEVGICFFKKFWRSAWTLPLAAMSAEWAFDHLNVHLLLGTTPEPNRSAIAFFKRLGFGWCGPIPAYTTFPGIDGPVGVYSSFVTKPEWAEVRKRWFEDC